MNKIIYFDESSALDILDIKNKGRAEEILNTMVEKAKKFSLEGSLGSGILDFFNVFGSANAAGGFSRKKSNLLTINITNTILTSFIDLIKNNERENYGLVELNNYNLTIPKDSAAFIKSITPFTKIFKGTVESLGDESINIDLQSIDEVLQNAKGYYEVLATLNDDDKKDKKIVRFNLDGFRNNYKLNDLQKMSLTLYGIKVGKTTEDNLSFYKEFDGEKKKSKPSEIGFDPHKSHEMNLEPKQLDIIDIILAGIKI